MRARILGAWLRSGLRTATGASVVAAVMVMAWTSPAAAAGSLFTVTSAFDPAARELTFPGSVGGSLYSAGGDVVVYPGDSFALYTNELWLVSPASRYITTLVGHADTLAESTGFTFTTAGVPLGSMPSGRELVLALRNHVGPGGSPSYAASPDPSLVPPWPWNWSYGPYLHGGEYVFYTGPGSRNPDSTPHAKVQFMVGGQFAPSGVAAFVGFEDIYKPVLDYNDTSAVVVGAVSQGGCTLTIGYWKNHAAALASLLPITLGSGGGTSVAVTSGTQAAALLGYSGNASNGIAKLYGQLLATKLNVVDPPSSANASSIAQTVVQSDAFLAQHGAADWNGLSSTAKGQVLRWASVLDGYNNGLSGPGHCGDTEATKTTTRLTSGDDRGTLRSDTSTKSSDSSSSSSDKSSGSRSGKGSGSTCLS